MQVVSSNRKTKIYEDLAHLFPLWREACLEEKGRDLKETGFITQVFQAAPRTISSVIDLGGGVGTHSKGLVKGGYAVTLFDQSQNAIAIAKQDNPGLVTVTGSFETISLNSQFDAAICMWSTLTYALDEEGRKNFYQWIKENTGEVVILDQANFHTYPRLFHKVYEAENEEYAIRVIRDWVLDPDNCKHTKFVYELFNKRTKKTEIIEDEETQQYLTIDRLKHYLGKEWDLTYLLGDYDLAKQYEVKDSSRLITVFTK